METTLCMIVKDEESNLRQCIESFQGLFSDLVIVDTGSKDNSKTVAHAFEAAVFDYKWNDDFSAARNFALSKIKTKWTLIVDADDRITLEDKKKLLIQLDQLNDSTKIISCPYVYSKQSGPRYRFFQTNLGLRFKYPVHEKLEIPEELKEFIVSIDLPFQHQKSKEDFDKGFKRNIDIMEKFIQNNPEDLRILYYLSHDYFMLKDYEQALDWCDKFLNANEQDPYKLNQIHVRKGRCHEKLNQLTQAISSYMKAIDIAPQLIEPYLHLGDISANQERFDEALEFYDLAKTCTLPNHPELSFNKDRYETAAQLRIEKIKTFTNPK